MMMMMMTMTSAVTRRREVRVCPDDSAEIVEHSSNNRQQFLKIPLFTFKKTPFHIIKKEKKSRLLAKGPKVQLSNPF